MGRSIGGRSRRQVGERGRDAEQVVEQVAAGSSESQLSVLGRVCSMQEPYDMV